MMLFGRYAKNGHIFIYTLRAFVFLLSVAVGVAAESTKSPSNKINSATAPSSSLKPKSSAKSPSAGLKSTVWIWDKPYNPSKEVAEISRLADEGNLRAQAEMSLRHRLGDGVPLDTTKALRFCEANTHPIAQYSLSRMLSSGHGVKKDQQRADKILREVFGALRLLSDQRDGLATAILGVYSELGLSNVSLDIVEAEKLYRESLSQGHDYGLVGLAKILLLKGEPESREGRGLLHDACSKGSSPALRALLDEKLDRSGDWSGWKKGEPTEETILLVNKLAALSDTSALRALHDISMSGDGKYKDDARAFKISGLLREKGEDVDYEQARHYMNGTGVLKNYQLGFKLAMKSAMNGNRGSCTLLSWAYHHGHGVPKSYVSAYAWALIAAAKGAFRNPDEALKPYESYLGPLQIAESQKIAASLEAEIALNRKNQIAPSESVSNKTTSLGTGFFLSESGYIATSFHVISGAKKITVRARNGEMSAVVVVIDQANDIAVIKAPMQGKPLTMGCVSEVVAGNPVYTVGFPNPSIQGVEPKLTKGDINSMTGLRDDPRMFQISVPVQPGNSGGPLVNKNREVIGIITSRVSDFAVLSNSGTLPQSVNYAMKAVYLKALVESNKDLRAAVEFTGAEKVDSSNPESVIESVVLISAEK